MGMPDFVEKDYYATLGVPKDADKNAIRKAYRKLARECHPDVKPGDKVAEERFKEISEAYDVLSDEQRRREYDEARELFASGGFRFGGPGGAPGQGGMPIDLEDLLGGGGLGGLFGTMFGGGGRRGRRRGADVEADLSVDFEDAVAGATLPLQLTEPRACSTCGGSGAKPGTSAHTCSACNGTGHVARQQGGFAISEPCRVCRGNGTVVDDPCPTCHGSGQQVATSALSVRIPAGVADGQRIRIAGRGQPGTGGGPRGDLLVRVHVRPHPVFGRKGDDLTVTLPVTFPEAALGTTVPVPLLGGGSVTVKIPPGTSSGRVLRVRGKGVTRKGRKTGDLLATVDVVVPSHVNGKAKEALEAYHAALAESGEKDGPELRAHLYAEAGGSA